MGVLVADDGRLLIAQRRAGTPGAGCWEFPGGKREPGETLRDCLARELAEEIGVQDISAEPLIRFAHDHGAKPVRLHVWRVDRWSGKVHGRENQRMRWVTRAALSAVDLLPATDAILHALFLPRRYLITPAVAPQGQALWLTRLDAALAAGIRLIRLRDHALDDAAYAALAAQVVARAHARGARVLIDRDRHLLAASGADGLHWPAARLASQGRPARAHCHLLAVSAHNGRELEKACRLGADFAVLSPVAPTPSHPEAAPLGWPNWARERADHALPVYALGGLDAEDIDTARTHNAQGVAAIRGFWA